MSYKSLVQAAKDLRDLAGMIQEEAANLEAIAALFQGGGEARAVPFVERAGAPAFIANPAPVYQGQSQIQPQPRPQPRKVYPPSQILDEIRKQVRTLFDQWTAQGMGAKEATARIRQMYPELHPVAVTGILRMQLKARKAQSQPQPQPQSQA